MLYSPGLAALALFPGDPYWYPVRLIQYHPANQKYEKRWTIKIWRGCIFSPSAVVSANEWVEVAEKNLVDALESDRNVTVTRREIRVSRND